MLSWQMRAAVALRFKENEHDVFRQLHRHAAGELSRDLFRDLAEKDRSHVSRLKEMAEEGAAEMDEEAAYALRQLVEKAEGARDDSNAVRVGLEIKRQAYEFYRELCHAAENAFERSFYSQLADEERQSLLCLVECQEYLTNTPSYFGRKERVNLDG